MTVYPYKIGEGAMRTINSLLPRVQKGNQAAAAVTLIGNTPALRRGSGAGKLIRLDVNLWIHQNTPRSLSFSWPNKEGKSPLLLAFSLRGSLDGSKALKPEDLVIFDHDCEDTQQVQTLFVTGDSDTQALGYVYTVEEGANDTQIAWLIFVNQTQAGNRTVTRFGSPESFAALVELISHGIQPLTQTLCENDSLEKGESAR